MKPYYDKNGITIYNGDWLKIMKQFDDKSFDLVLTDPPYGTTACEWDNIIPIEPMWIQLKRLIKINGAIVMTASQPFTTKLISSNMEMFKYEWIWDKKSGLGFLDCKFRPLKSHENIVVFSFGGISNNSNPPMKYNPQGLKQTNKINRNKPSNILNSEPKKREFKNVKTGYPKTIQTFNREVGLHPTQKPVALMEYLIKTYTNRSDIVLDFAMGSGTTLLAAKGFGRKAVGIEISKEYCDVAVERIKEEDEKGVLFELHD